MPGLTAGGLVLLPVALAVEGLPPQGVDAPAVAGFAYLAVVGTAAAYALWFRGVVPGPLRPPRPWACSAPWSPPPPGGWCSTKASPVRRASGRSSSSPP